MAAQVLSFFQRSPRYAPAPADWSQQELAEFYRVESALIRAGVRVGTDRGLSDEKEPWFVFYRADDGEVVIHFARIDGEYIIAGPAYEEIARGFDFSALVRNMVARHPLVRRPQGADNISIHPAALLVAVVGTAFFKTGEARAAEVGATHAPQQPAASRPALLSSSAGSALKNSAPSAPAPQYSYDSVQLPANQAVLILAAALLASDYGVSSASIDPAAHSAISAAAAALDFGAPAATSSSDSALPLSGSSHAPMVDNSPEHMVSSTLALVALLSIRPAIDARASETPDASVASIVHQDMEVAAPVARLPTDPANWSLEVRLTAGVLPSVEAVQLVRGIVGDANAQKISVIEVTQLPDVLADLIARGAHYTAASNAAAQAQPVTTDPVTPAPAEAGQTHETGTPHATTPPASELSKPAPSVAPDAIVPKPAPAPAPAAPVYTSLDLAKQFVDYFVSHTDHISIMMQGQKVVMYDDRVLHDSGSVDHVTSVNFDFTDGSAISLIGAQSAFLHGGNLV
jgi:hypothetical protein